MVRESSSSFYRSIDLPEQANESVITGTFDKGVLTIKIPFTEVLPPKKIVISTEKVS